MKYKSISSIVGALAPVFLLNHAANAANFSGYDQNFGTTPLTTATSPNSQAAFNTFSSNLNGSTVTTESFETIPVGTPIDGLNTSISGTTAIFSYTTKATPGNPSIPVAGTSTTSVQQAAASGASAGFTNSGTYPTDGTRGISINSTNNFSISFNNTLAAFGYFGTDLGDASNTLTMNFYNGTTLVNSYSIPQYVGGLNSSEFFSGFIADNSTQYFNKVEFSSSSTSLTGDAIGIDQIKIGTPTQVVNQVPEPSSLVGTLLFGGSIVLMKRSSKRRGSMVKPMFDNE